MMKKFDKEYFQSVNYVDYLSRGDRYDKTAQELLDFFDKIEIFDKNKYALDFGCAVGHLLNALIKRNVTRVYGVDISDWAIEYAREQDLPVAKEVRWDLHHSIVFALDVFEHMPVDKLREFFLKIKTDAIVFRIPVCKNKGEDYVLEVSRNDPTHVIRWTKDEWKNFFSMKGYITFNLNLYSLYNSEGVYSGIAVKI